MIVLDTNVVSELLTPAPDASVEAWLTAQPPASIFTTAITQAEILYGLRLLPDGKRRTELEAAIRPIFTEDFEDRVLSFGPQAAEIYAHIAVVRRQAGRPISQFDAQIAAIALSRGAALATRNVADFAGIGLTILNPWQLTT
ncbi:type II toxin-antitoxin system VapC family toxin [Bosea sp. (in: a-proteobacteria)]|uniref:type II toxin-antitoxin system VapC family toxin n=1 Tax=Bosea sp. (in: a-proteobacteria) TaxID=1871050 RepID=UPI0027353A40|nr:type II toxin-antitoxin system VapC family toxin [Bosea sp. (in: a-proteobacteria)]MDP3408493.1 type II toxin-antitoxin system VapC family toxin [Bosea sp. (in: a-proteobacteria)]